MKILRGFGKNYFSFASMTAHSVAHKLENQNTVSGALCHLFTGMDSECDEKDPPELLLEAVVVQASKPCHCNCFFKRKTRLILLLNHYIPRCPFYCTYFAFRRSGVHPPFIVSF